VDTWRLRHRDGQYRFGPMPIAPLRQGVAFDALARHSFQRKSEKELNELVRAAKNQPSDERLPYWRSQLNS